MLLFLHFSTDLDLVCFSGRAKFGSLNFVPSVASNFFFLTSRKLFHMKFAIFDVARCRMSATSLTFLLILRIQFACSWCNVGQASAFWLSRTIYLRHGHQQVTCNLTVTVPCLVNLIDLLHIYMPMVMRRLIVGEIPWKYDLTCALLVHYDWPILQFYFSYRNICRRQEQTWQKSLLLNSSHLYGMLYTKFHEAVCNHMQLYAVIKVWNHISRLEKFTSSRTCWCESFLGEFIVQGNNEISAVYEFI